MKPMLYRDKEITDVQIIQGDCLEESVYVKGVDLVFLDPPDNIKLNYEGYSDMLPEAAYYYWLECLLSRLLGRCRELWISYYWKHDVEIKYIIRCLLRRHLSYGCKTFIWRFTFGQHNQSDYGSGFRFLVRLSRDTILPEYVESERQLLGDKRACSLGRIPDDVFEGE